MKTISASGRLKLDRLRPGIVKDVGPFGEVQTGKRFLSERIFQGHHVRS